MSTCTARVMERPSYKLGRIQRWLYIGSLLNLSKKICINLNVAHALHKPSCMYMYMYMNVAHHANLQ